MPKSKATPTSLVWDPSGKLDLVCVDNQGNINRFEGMVSTNDTIKVPILFPSFNLIKLSCLYTLLFLKPILCKIDSDVALADQYADLFDDGDDDDMIAATCDTENNISCAQSRSSSTKIPDDDSDDDNDGFGKGHEKSRINKMSVEDDESRGRCCSSIIFSFKLILYLIQ